MHVHDSKMIQQLDANSLLAWDSGRVIGIRGVGRYVVTLVKIITW